MQRINMTHPGGVDVLYIEDAAIPEPQAGELLIKTIRIARRYVLLLRATAECQCRG